MINNYKLFLKDFNSMLNYVSDANLIQHMENTFLVTSTQKPTPYLYDYLNQTLEKILCTTDNVNSLIFFIFMDDEEIPSAEEVSNKEIYDRLNFIRIIYGELIKDLKQTATNPFSIMGISLNSTKNSSKVNVSFNRNDYQSFYLNLDINSLLYMITQLINGVDKKFNELPDELDIETMNEYKEAVRDFNASFSKFNRKHKKDSIKTLREVATTKHE